MDALLEWLKPLLESYSSQYPWLFVTVTVMGSFRLFFKPVMTIVQNVILLTPSKADDEFFQKMLDSKVYKAVAFLVDWFASIKLPKK